MFGDLLTFGLAGVLVVAAGVALTRAADDLASCTGLGRVWMGSVLLAAATSLPELGVNVAATRQGSLDLAVGDIFGSNMFNMLILGVLGLVPPRDEVFRRASLDHMLAGGLGVILQGVAALLILTRSTTQVAGVSPFALLLGGLFVLGTWILYRQSNSHGSGSPQAVVGASLDSHDDRTHAQARAARSRVWVAPLLRFGVATVVILVAAPAFASSAEAIAEQSGLGATFFGTIVVGAATSLPEVVACVTAMRMGAFDLAVGNLFGSNLFNVTIFLAMDVADGPGSLFAHVAPAHVVAAIYGIVLTALGSVAVGFRVARRQALVEPGSVLMIVAYGAAVASLVVMRGVS